MPINPFIQYLEFEKRYSAHTITAYRNDLEQFFTYLKNAYDIQSAAEVKHLYIRSWMVSLMELPVSPRSVNRKISTLKSFFRFLLNRNIVTENPMSKVFLLKTAKRLPVFLAEDKMIQLLDNLDFGTGLVAKRDKLILELFYATGIRLSELVNLKRKDVSTFNSTIKVLGKRSKERIVPVNNSVVTLIADYEKDCDAMGFNKRDFFFITEKGSKVYSKLVYRIVNSYLSKITTIDKKSPHILRHTFATHMLNNGAELTAIKEILGHSSLAATQVYTHNSIEKLKNIYKQAHPKA